MKEKNTVSTADPREQDLTFPQLYLSFLENIQNGGIYEIKEYDANYFMIGQDGDLGYFVNAKDSNDESIYSNDLGAIGSLPMKKEAENIIKFNKNII